MYRDLVTVRSELPSTHAATRSGGVLATDRLAADKGTSKRRSDMRLLMHTVLFQPATIFQLFRQICM